MKAIDLQQSAGEACQLSLCCRSAEHTLSLCAASSDAVASAAAPPAPGGTLCGEVVEARVHEGLHFCSGAQTISFGDSPQVCCFTSGTLLGRTGSESPTGLSPSCNSLVMYASEQIPGLG